MTTEPERTGYMLCECGCEFWNEGGEGGAFVIRPCRLDCQIYRLVLAETRQLGTPLEFQRRD